MPRFSGFLAALLVAGCASAPPTAPEPPVPENKSAPPPTFPATYRNIPGCPGCLAVTITLRPDGSYLAREQLGTAEFYDFGRWQLAGDTLELHGGRDQRRYALSALRRAPQVEALRGPFRLVGVYDGTTFRECRTGIAWGFSDTRAAENLRLEFQKQGASPGLVALDAQFEGAPEKLRMFRPATFLNTQSCPAHLTN